MSDTERNAFHAALNGAKSSTVSGLVSECVRKITYLDNLRFKEQGRFIVIFVFLMLLSLWYEAKLAETAPTILENAACTRAILLTARMFLSSRLKCRTDPLELP